MPDDTPAAFTGRMLLSTESGERLGAGVRNLPV
jgi:hypothetical protein